MSLVSLVKMQGCISNTCSNNCMRQDALVLFGQQHSPHLRTMPSHS
jgi:hypothetical protein